MNDLVILPKRDAGRAWAGQGIAARLRVIARLRRLIARDAAAIAASIARPDADTLVAEVLPLAEAARFLVREGARILAPVRPRGGRPLWLFGTRAEIWREPCGAVLILAPGNYPLFLPGVQAIQALVAGNAVAVKPAPGCAAPMQALAALLQEAGLPPGVLDVLDPAEGEAAVRAGFDHIVLTGSAETGARVLAAAGLTPCTMELSGSDAVFVLPGADLDLVAACLAYGLRLNGGATCIAPRRVFCTDQAGIEARLLPRLMRIPNAQPSEQAGRLVQRMVAGAADAGARVLSSGPGRPTVLADATAGMPGINEDIFAPWLALVPVRDMDHAIAAAARCPYALGASIFGPEDAARALAARVHAGSVCINDLITPTADPRLPFGGRGRSGFGVTRGAEGLLRMTMPKTVSTRRRFRPHLQDPNPADVGRFAAMTRLLHGEWKLRLDALRSIVISQ